MSQNKTIKYKDGPYAINVIFAFTTVLRDVTIRNSKAIEIMGLSGVKFNHTGSNGGWKGDNNPGKA